MRMRKSSHADILIWWILIQVMVSVDGGAEESIRVAMVTRQTPMHNYLPIGHPMNPLDTRALHTTAETTRPEVLPVGPAEGPLTKVTAIVGGNAMLPCNVTARGDSPILVLLYNGATGKPVYSIDAREGSMSHSKHWSSLGSRAKFNLTSPLTFLLIQDVEAEDDGDYRCRVDFSSSPTRNLRVKLLVVVPPDRVSISSANGRVLSGVIGPYALGTSLSLSCQVFGGRPMPQVTWWHDGSLLDDHSEQSSIEVTVNVLTLPNLSRQHLYRVLTCRATNSNMTDPIFSSVTLDMSFPPEDVRVIGDGLSPLVAGRKATMECEAFGSRPSAQLSWWMDGKYMKEAKPTPSQEANISRSILELIPLRNHNNVKVVCRAENADMPGSTLEDSVTLNVQYAPEVSLRAGHNLMLTNIKERDDVYFECVIQANPKAFRVQWFLEGQELVHNVSAGLIQSNQSLVLQRVSRSSSGRYTCTATNILGHHTSEPLLLKVKFAPTCTGGQKLTYGGGRMKPVNVTCNVDAHPPADTFRWAFNTSTEMVNIAKNRSHLDHNRSIMAYTPHTHHDYGSLLCWASNEVGDQQVPCVFLVVPAAVPERVYNCSSWHNTSAAGEVVVVCEAGWGGGLQQIFTLEVRRSPDIKRIHLTSHDPHSQTNAAGYQGPFMARGSKPEGAIVATLENREEPHFTVTGLTPGTEYHLSVVARNSQGRAPATTFLHLTPIDVAEKRTSPSAAGSNREDTLHLMPIIGGVAGVLTGIIVCSVVLALILRGRGHRFRPAHAHHTNAKGGKESGVYDKAAVTFSTCDDGGFDQLHRDPDLILIKERQSDCRMLENPPNRPHSTASKTVRKMVGGETSLSLSSSTSSIPNPISGSINLSTINTSSSGMTTHPSSSINPTSSINPSSTINTSVSINPTCSAVIHNDSPRDRRQARPLSMTPPSALTAYQDILGRSTTYAGLAVGGGGGGGSGVGGGGGVTAPPSYNSTLGRGDMAPSSTPAPSFSTSSSSSPSSILTRRTEPLTYPTFEGGNASMTSATLPRGASFTSSPNPRRSSTVALQRDFFPADFSTSRESCV